jgi:hypothetical protein
MIHVGTTLSYCNYRSIKMMQDRINFGGSNREWKCSPFELFHKRKEPDFILNELISINQSLANRPCCFNTYKEKVITPVAAYRLSKMEKAISSIKPSLSTKTCTSCGYYRTLWRQGTSEQSTSTFLSVIRRMLVTSDLTTSNAYIIN